MLRLSKVSLIFACGTALFSDGYANNVIGSVVTILRTKYGTDIITPHKSTLLSSLAFAGTVMGMLIFGYLSDKLGRKFGMMVAAGIVTLFSLLAACARGAGGSTTGLVSALAAYRFLLGIGIGAEYPCGSVAASEQTEEKGIGKRSQNRWLALATNAMIDFGFVIGAFVPLVMFWIFGENHLSAVWRGSLAFGVIPAVGVFIWRLRMEEPTRYKKDCMKYAPIPYSLVLKRYWVRLAAISFIWFLYDFISYPFGLFSSTIINSVVPSGASLSVVFGWSVVIKLPYFLPGYYQWLMGIATSLFYMPGTIVGAFVIDYIGARYTMIIGLLLQAVIGFILSATYSHLKNHVAGFAILYGIFLSFGEFAPGNCTMVFASKTGPTAIRGHFYGIAAATGKVGAFVGTWVFPPLINAFGGADSDRGNSGPFYIGSGLAILSAIITFFFLTPIPVDGMEKEDADFRDYLTAHGYDISQMGLGTHEDDKSDQSISDEKAAAA